MTEFEIILLQDLHCFEFAVDPVGLFCNKFFDLSVRIEFGSGNHQAFLGMNSEPDVPTAPGFFKLVGDYLFLKVDGVGGGLVWHGIDDKISSDPKLLF